jgi:hypothetical protein
MVLSGYFTYFFLGLSYDQRIYLFVLQSANMKGLCAISRTRYKEVVTMCYFLNQSVVARMFKIWEHVFQ